MILAEKAGFRPSLQPVDDECRSPVAVVLRPPGSRPSLRVSHPPAGPPSCRRERPVLRLIEPLAAMVLSRRRSGAIPLPERCGRDRPRIPRSSGSTRSSSRNPYLLESSPVQSGDEPRPREPRRCHSPSSRPARPPIPGPTAMPVLVRRSCRASTCGPLRILLDQAILHSKNVHPACCTGSSSWRDRRAAARPGRCRSCPRSCSTTLEELARNLAKKTRTPGTSLYIAVAAVLGSTCRRALADHRRPRATPIERTSRVTCSRFARNRYYGLIAYRRWRTARRPMRRKCPGSHDHPADRSIPPSSRSALGWHRRTWPAPPDRRDPDLARGRGLRPYALGLMAKAVAPTDRGVAVQPARRGIRCLGPPGLRRLKRAEPRASVTAAALLPVVEAIEPDRLSDFLGRALLLRGARGDQTGLAGNGVAHVTSRLAVLMAQYDRGLAARLLQPELERLGRTSRASARITSAPAC